VVVYRCLLPSPQTGEGLAARGAQSVLAGEGADVVVDEQRPNPAVILSSLVWP
jgi:hypothetical protein